MFQLWNHWIMLVDWKILFDLYKDKMLWLYIDQSALIECDVVHIFWVVKGIHMLAGNRCIYLLRWHILEILCFSMMTNDQRTTLFRCLWYWIQQKGAWKYIPYYSTINREKIDRAVTARVKDTCAETACKFLQSTMTSCLNIPLHISPLCCL